MEAKVAKRDAKRTALGNPVLELDASEEDIARQFLLEFPILLWEVILTQLLPPRLLTLLVREEVPFTTETLKVTFTLCRVMLKNVLKSILSWLGYPNRLCEKSEPPL